MPVKEVHGNIFDSDCEFLTNTINTSGAMGIGLALEFRLRLPDMYGTFLEMSRKGELRIGRYWIYDKQNRLNKKVLNFPTKRDFRQPSKFEYLWEGLDYFRDHFREDGIGSIAFPLLGARQGGIDPEITQIFIHEYLDRLPLPVELYDNQTPDRFTATVLKFISNSSADGLSKALGISVDASGYLKSKTNGITHLSDLVTLGNVRINIIQRLYDYAFTKLVSPRMGSDQRGADSGS